MTFSPMSGRRVRGSAFKVGEERVGSGSPFSLEKVRSVAEPDIEFGVAVDASGKLYGTEHRSTAYDESPTDRRSPGERRAHVVRLGCRWLLILVPLVVIERTPDYLRLAARWGLTA